MRLEIKKYLYDIQYAIGLLREFTGDKKFADYERDTMMRSAVERQFEIIGEAMSQLAKLDSVLASRISNYQRSGVQLAVSLASSSFLFATFLSMAMPMWIIGWFGM
jgi:hypothetical protein